jgi:hypothetical protein
MSGASVRAVLAVDPSGLTVILPLGDFQRHERAHGVGRERTTMRSGKRVLEAAEKFFGLGIRGLRSHDIPPRSSCAKDGNCESAM